MTLPRVDVSSSTVGLAGGVDRISTSMTARQGSATYASNYESVFGGGFGRIGGFERFDGRPRPSDATYTAMRTEAAHSIALGDAVTGSTSGATGTCIYIDTYLVALTKVTGTFLPGEDLLVFGLLRGVNSATPPTITSAQDNAINAAAADEYRDDIAAVPGDGPVRGIAALGSDTFAWRDDGAALKLYKATASGWTAVALGEQIAFSNANADIADAETLTQGGVTATIARVVLETGTFLSGTNTGRLILTGRSGGNYSAGAATASGGAALTLGGAQTAISLLAGGRVFTDRFNFTASLDTLRLYGCDGVNPEFEFDGAVYVPLTIATGSVRATTVRCHKNHVFFGFRGSLQHSGIAAPYQFTVVTGASEIGTGDTITGLITVAGSEDRAALLVLCEDSSYVLFGNDSSEWQFTPLSREAGCRAYSSEDVGGAALVYDAPGVRLVKPTDAFGNFNWEIATRLIDPLAQNRTPVASVFTKAFSRYRVFFDDGTAISGTPAKSGWDWTTIDYGITVSCTYSTEIDDATRTFLGDDDGFVYETDVGRSFDGEEILAVLRLHGLHQRSPVVEKTYRWGLIESIGQSPFTLLLAAEFDDGHVDKAPSDDFGADMYGAGASWDASDWDACFWDTRRLDRRRVSCNGSGYSISPIIVSRASDELPHQIKTFTVVYTSRRIARR